MSLPSGYKRLEYIKFTGTQYLPNITIPQDFKIEVTLAAGTPGSYTNIYDNNMNSPMLWIDGSKILEMNTVKSGYALTTQKVTIISDATGGNNVLSVNGTVVQTASKIIGTSFTVTLFNRRGAQCFVGDFYGFLASSATEKIVDYIPCITDYGEIGVYDLVSMTFVGNAGTGAFTAGPVVDPYGNDENTLLLLHGEDLTDSSPNGVAITNNGVSVSDAQSKFGGKSLYFNGTSRLQADGSIFDFGTGDFTVDFWAYKQAGNGGFYLSPSVIGGLMIGPYTGTSIGIGREAVAWDTTIDISAAQNNKWNHIAVVRKSGVISVFVNGSKVGSAANTQTYNMNGGKLAVGVQSYELYGNQHAFTGYIDEYRISNIARWTEDFTPPTEPYKSKYPPPAPATLQHLLAVRLAWSAVDGASSYNIYRDGVLLTNTKETTFIDLTAAENTEYTYGVSAVNSAGESTKTTLKVYTKAGYFLCKPVVESANFQ